MINKGDVRLCVSTQSLKAFIANKTIVNLNTGDKTATRKLITSALWFSIGRCGALGDARRWRRKENKIASIP
jgi:hypothetical protein